MGMQRRQFRAGFTIIEVLLFLGITGLLALSLLTGWTTMINTQRYKDSVKTVQSFLQQQYAMVYNVENGRDATLGCTGSASGPVVNDIVSQQPGQSSCIVMGRYIRISGTNQKITVFSIVGEDGETDGSLTDKQIIKDRQPVRIDQSLGLTNNELNIPWGATVTNSSGDTIDVVMLVIRSPQTGSVHTYTQTVPTGALPAVTSVIDQPNSEKGIDLCLDPGAPLSGGRMGVAVTARASAQSFIQTVPDGAGRC